MSKAALSMDLPRVGDKLMRVVTEYACEYDSVRIPKACVVTYVNKKHGWYRVKFIESGITECYGLPVCDHSIINFDMRGCCGLPVICVETGMAYSTVTECAEDLGVHRTMIQKQLVGECSHVSGYHFVKIL